MNELCFFSLFSLIELILKHIDRDRYSDNIFIQLLETHIDTFLSPLKQLLIVNPIMKLQKHNITI